MPSNGKTSAAGGTTGGLQGVIEKTEGLYRMTADESIKGMRAQIDAATQAEEDRKTRTKKPLDRQASGKAAS